MKIRLYIKVFVITSMLTQVACAGTKSLDVKMRNVGEADFYNSPIFKQYLENRHNEDRDECWHNYGDGMSGIGFFSYGMLTLVNGHKLQDLWDGKAEIIQKIRKGLHQENENTASEGYHGMYIIYHKNGYLTIMGIGANADPKKGLTGISPVIKGIKLDQTKPKEGAKIFERSLCRVSKPFNIGFGV